MSSPKDKKSNLLKPSTKNPARALYGDMVCNLCGLVVLPLHGWELYQLIKEGHPKTHEATIVFIAMVVPQLFFILAVFFQSIWCSRLAFCWCVFLNSYSNLVEWPHAGECTITVLFQGGVVMSVGANISLPFYEKLIRMVIFFVVGSYVSLRSPHSVYHEDTLPILGGTIIVAIFILYVYHHGVAMELATVRGAQLVLAALFVHHAAVDLLTMEEGSYYQKLSSFIKAAGLACIGIVATGTFQNEVFHKEQLAVLVRHRTEEIQTQNKKLRMVNLALQASETAIAITNQCGHIIWLNDAFGSLGGSSCPHRKNDNNTKASKMEEVPNSSSFFIGLPLKDAIYKLDPMRKENKYILMEALDDSTKPSEDEVQIGKSLFRLTVMPFKEDAEASEEEQECRAATIGTEAIPIIKRNDRFLIVFKDITEERARQDAEKKAHDEAMMAKAMGDSMVTLTHELRTPLQGIMGVTSLLLQQLEQDGGSSTSSSQEELNNEIFESLKLIMASSSLLLNLINNLLDVKKANSKMMEGFPLSPIPANDPIKDAIGFCQPLAHISNVDIVSDVIAAPNAIVNSNTLRLQQVLINLISNGIKYTKRGSKICIETRTHTMSQVQTMMDKALATSCTIQENQQKEAKEQEDDDCSVLVFSISDCGSGIPPNQAGRLFRRFAQLDTQPKRVLGNNKVGQPKGTGLGLHLCQLFVERMKGQIWATNNTNGIGSSFCFYLPLVSNAPKQPDAIWKAKMGHECATATTNTSPKEQGSTSRQQPCSPTLAGGEGRLAEKNMSQLRVLLVDDTLINRKVFDRMLKKIGIASVLTVDGGQNALEALSSTQYDLVITDLQMPGMSGIELSIAINEADSPPIVVGLTADTSVDVAERCAASGMADVLYKPITVAEMKNYFNTVIPQLEPGTWHADSHGGNTNKNGRGPPQ